MKDRLTTAPLPLERPQGYFVLFVGRRYYLRPPSAASGPGTRKAQLERPPALERAKRYWNGLRPWNAAGFLRLHVHVCAMETQKITSVKNTKFCKYEVETIAGTRRLQNQPPHTCFFIGPLRGKISSPFACIRVYLFSVNYILQ